ncbi:MAG: hypothetical protein DRN90_05765, partial [Thermoproteota archaeon]
LYESFIRGEEEYGEVWQKVIAPLNLEDLLRVKGQGVDEVEVPADLWARVLFDYIVAYRDEVVERPLLLNSLIPIYYIRTLSFVNSTKEMEIKEAEEFLEEECRIMEAEKYYLIAKWNQTPRRDGLPSIAQFLAEAC